MSIYHILVKSKSFMYIYISIYTYIHIYTHIYYQKIAIFNISEDVTLSYFSLHLYIFFQIPFCDDILFFINHEQILDTNIFTCIYNVQNPKFPVTLNVF